MTSGARRRVAGRSVVMVLLTAATVVPLTGCAPVVCAGAAARSPEATVQAQPWLAAHPAGVAHACYAGSCEDATVSQPVVELLVSEKAGLDAVHRLTVTLTADGRASTRTISFRLRRTPPPPNLPCPFPDQWTRAVAIGADGRLHLDQLVGAPGPTTAPTSDQSRKKSGRSSSSGVPGTAA